MEKSSKGWLWIPSLYFTEGLPYVVVLTVTATMYKRMGIPNDLMAFYTSLLGLPWAFKPLWSPFVDIFSSRRRWVIAMQFMMSIGFAAVAFALPGHAWFQASIAAFMVVAFLSATNDTASDGFYMLALSTKDQSFFVGIRTTFYRLAMIVGQGPLVLLAGLLETAYGDIPRAWSYTFYILAGVTLLTSVYHLFALPRPSADRDRKTKSVAEVRSEFIDTFRQFFTKPSIVGAIVFMLLYKLPEVQLGKLINAFLVDPPAEGGLGLTTIQYGLSYGTIGVAGLLAGGIIGGILVARNGLRRWIVPMAWSMSLSCLSFLWLSLRAEPTIFEIYSGVLIEQFGYGFGTTAYILYLIEFSKGRFATANYALCTGIMALGAMLAGMTAGWIQQQIGYTLFFCWTMVCCTATILVAYAARRRLQPE